MSGIPPGSSILDDTVKESQSLMYSLRKADDAIETAGLVSERLNNQMSYLRSSNDRLEQIISTVPVIGNLTSKIEIRRRRDRLILGGLIGFLMFFCVWYLFG